MGESWVSWAGARKWEEREKRKVETVRRFGKAREVYGGSGWVGVSFFSILLFLLFEAYGILMLERDYRKGLQFYMDLTVDGEIGQCDSVLHF